MRTHLDVLLRILWGHLRCIFHDFSLILCLLFYIFGLHVCYFTLNVVTFVRFYEHYVLNNVGFRGIRIIGKNRIWIPNSIFLLDVSVLTVWCARREISFFLYVFHSLSLSLYLSLSLSIATWLSTVQHYNIDFNRDFEFVFCYIITLLSLV